MPVENPYAAPSMQANQNITCRYMHVTAKEGDSDTDNEDCSSLTNLTAGPDPNSNPYSNPHSDPSPIRFCRICEDFIPITDFPRGQRRYTCRVHQWERNGIKAKKNLLMKPRQKFLARMKNQCDRDCAVFGQPRMELTQADIDSLLDMDPRMQRLINLVPISPGTSTLEQPMGFDRTEFANAANAAAALTVMPRDPTKPLSKANAKLVSKTARRQMLELWRA